MLPSGNGGWGRARPPLDSGTNPLIFVEVETAEDEAVREEI